MAEGLVTVGAAHRVYGVVVHEAAGYPRIDLAATAARRDAIRAQRLGGRRPRPPLEGGSSGRRFSEALTLVGPVDAEALACRRCGAELCPATANVYDHVVVQREPTASRAPLGLAYAGSDRFVVSTCFCPSCGRQLDIQVGRVGEPLLRAVEPLADPSGP